MNQDIDIFLEHLARGKNYSENTVAAYRNDLSQLATYIEVEQAKGLIKSRNELLKSYLLKLREKKYSAATIARKIAAAKSFFKFMIESGKLKDNPTQNLISPQVNKHQLKFLSPSEYQLLLTQPTELSTPEAKRDIVMLELLYFTGLRVSELIALNVQDIDLEQNCLHCGHGSSRRKAPFNYHMGQLLKSFIKNDRLDLLFDDKERALFLNLRGRRLTRQGFWQIIKNYATKANLGAKATPQTLRHSFAMHKLETGTDLHSLQQLLGHAYISSTKVYEQSRFRTR
jgi:integrase/recombinase XerD